MKLHSHNKGITCFCKELNDNPQRLTEQDVRDDLKTLFNAGGGHADIDPILLSRRVRLIRTLNMILYMKYYNGG